MKEIKLTFDIKTGEVKIEAQGFHGSSCADATNFLKNTIGQMKDFKKKAEWYEQNISFGSLKSNLCG